MSSIKKQHVSIGRVTVEARRGSRVWLGKGLSGLPSSNIGPSPRRKAAWARVYSCQRKTAMEIMMGEEKAYRESQDGDVLAAQSRSCHNTVLAYYNAIRWIPRLSGVMEDARHHVSMLERLDAVMGGMYYSEKDELFVGDWSIQTPEIYHRHKELGMYFTADGMDFTGYHDDDLVDLAALGNYKTHIQWDAANGLCGLCGEQMSGEIMMMHRFYQF